MCRRLTPFQTGLVTVSVIFVTVTAIISILFFVQFFNKRKLFIASSYLQLKGDNDDDPLLTTKWPEVTLATLSVAKMTSGIVRSRANSTPMSRKKALFY